MHVCVNGVPEMATVQKDISRTTMTCFANVYAKRVPSVIQVVDPQTREGSSHAHPLQYLHGNPHNQR